MDFVGENGSTSRGLAMTRAAGDYHVVGYGENVDVPTIDLISSEKNIIGNLVGSYNDLQDPAALAATGAVTLHTQKYALDDFQRGHHRSRHRQRPGSRDPRALTLWNHHTLSNHRTLRPRRYP